MVNRVGGCLRIKLHQCGGDEIDIVNNVRQVHRDAKWFCFARDVQRIMGAIGRLGQTALTPVVIEKGIKFGVIHANQ